MVSYRAFIFQIFIPWGKTPPLIPKSRSYVKVKYQGHSLTKKKKKKKKKNGHCGGVGGIHVSQTRLVYCLYRLWLKIFTHYPAP